VTGTKFETIWVGGAVLVTQNWIKPKMLQKVTLELKKKNYLTKFSTD